MSTMELTARQQRERDYYNQYAQMHEQEVLEGNKFPIKKMQAGIERRPWNSYWSLFEFTIDEYKENARLLDFGSGPGTNALTFSEIGYEVEGFDISENNVEIANKLFDAEKRNGRFTVSFAEDLPYEDNSFDIIAGIDILHHVDIDKSLKECRRLLKTGAKAFFREPVDVPLLDRIRESKLVQLFAPKEASFDLHITEDERKLNLNDEKIMKQIFPKMKKHYYFIFARFDKFYRKGSDPKPSILEKLDYALIKMFPFMKKLGGAIIYELEK